MRTPADRTPPRGFQAFKGYENALTPAEVKARCGLAPTQGAHPRCVEAAIGELRDLISELPAEGVFTIDPKLHLVFGLDRRARAAQFLVTIARAYEEADILAGNYSNHLAALARGPLLKAKLRKARAVLGDDFEFELAAALAATRWPPPDHTEAKGIFKEVQDATGALREYESILDGSEPRRGVQKPDLPRLFFAMRLAEAFAFHTGMVPGLHASRSRRNVRPPAWLRFLSTALEIVSLPSRASGLDHLLRQVGKLPMAHVLKRLALGHALQLADLQSEAIKRDYSAPARPQLKMRAKSKKVRTGNHRKKLRK